jgi:hypothetical protein
MIDDFRISTGTALRQTSLAAMAAVALFITTAFLCAAAFVAVLNRYGPVEACFAGAAIFFVVTLIAAGTYIVRKRQIETRAAARAKAAAAAASTSLLAAADPRHRRTCAWPDGEPQPGGRSGARRIIKVNLERSGDAAARLQALGDFRQHADHGLAGNRHFALAGFELKRGRRRAGLRLMVSRNPYQHRGLGHPVDLDGNRLRGAIDALIRHPDSPHADGEIFARGELRCKRRRDRDSAQNSLA